MVGRQPRLNWPGVAALLGIVASLAVLWWAIAGPRPTPAQIDRAALGLRLSETTTDGRPPAFLPVADPVALREYFAGHQGPLTGYLGTPTIHADGSYSVPVMDTADGGLEWEAHVIGVVEWTGRDTAADEFSRCAFDEPVRVGMIRDVAADLAGDITADALTLIGTCDGGQPRVLVPLTRHEVAAVGVVDGLLGRRADAVDLPAGAVVLTEGLATVEERIDADDGLPVFPRQIARESFRHLLPDNPNLDAGTWVEPVYPALAPADGHLWWVMPISPPDARDTVNGYALMPADELLAGRLNPVTVQWLDEPLDGAPVLAGRALRLLEDLDGEPVDEVSVYLALPDAEGAWSGRVAFPPSITGGQAEVLFFVDVDADGTVCLHDLDGHEAGCRSPVDD